MSGGVVSRMLIFHKILALIHNSYIKFSLFFCQIEVKLGVEGRGVPNPNWDIPHPFWIKKIEEGSGMRIVWTNRGQDREWGSPTRTRPVAIPTDILHFGPNSSLDFFFIFFSSRNHFGWPFSTILAQGSLNSSNINKA